MTMDDGRINFDPNDVAEEAIPEFRDIRFVPAPASATKRLESQPDAVLVVNFDKFWMIVNELSGSSMTNIRRYGEKLQECIAHDAPGKIERKLADRYAEGLADGQAYVDIDRLDRVDFLEEEKKGFPLS